MLHTHTTKRGEVRARLGSTKVHIGMADAPGTSERLELVDQIASTLGTRAALQLMQCRTTYDLLNLYLEHARTFYVKAGKPTRVYDTARRVRDLLAPAMLGHLPPAAFGAPELLRWQTFLQAMGFGLTTINNYTGALRCVFRWAITQGLYTGAKLLDLRAVADLRRGRSLVQGMDPPTPPTRRLPVPDDVFARTIACAPTIVARMAELQRITGMRPKEVCALRACHVTLTTDPTVRVYHVPPEANKLDHEDAVRNVMLGPRALALLAPLWPADPTAFVFDPRLAVAERAERGRLTRKPGGSGNRKPHRQHPHPPSDHYTTTTYRRAIERACIRAGLAPHEEWTPARLRHTGGTRIAEESGDILVARDLLGHADVATTQIYVASTSARQQAAAKRLL